MIYWDTSSKGYGRRHAIWRLDIFLPDNTRIRKRSINRYFLEWMEESLKRSVGSLGVRNFGKF